MPLAWPVWHSSFRNCPSPQPTSTTVPPWIGYRFTRLPTRSEAYARNCPEQWRVFSYCGLYCINSGSNAELKTWPQLRQ